MGPIRASIIKYPIYVFGRSLLQNPAVEQKIPEEETCAPLSLPVPPANPAGQRPVRGAQFIPRTALTPHAAVWGSCCCPTRQLASSWAARWHLPNETGGSKAPYFHTGTWKEGITARNDAMGHLDLSQKSTQFCVHRAQEKYNRLWSRRVEEKWEDQWAKPCNKSCPRV